MKFSILQLHRLVWVSASYGVRHVLAPYAKIRHGKMSCTVPPAVCKTNARYGGGDVEAREGVTLVVLRCVCEIGEERTKGQYCRFCRSGRCCNEGVRGKQNVKLEGEAFMASGK